MQADGINLLIEFGAQVDALDNRLSTALHLGNSK